MRGSRYPGPWAPDCFFSDVKNGVRIKSSSTRGAYVRGVHIRNVTVWRANNAGVEITGIYDDGHFGPGTPNPACPAGWKPAAPPKMSDITVEGLYGGDCKVAFNLYGLSAAAPLTALNFSDVHLVRSGAWACNDNVFGAAAAVEPAACPELKPFFDATAKHIPWLERARLARAQQPHDTGLTF